VIEREIEVFEGKKQDPLKKEVFDEKKQSQTTEDA